MVNIPVILGSVRETRQSIKPAHLMVERLEAAGVDTRLVDLKELNLPFLDCPLEPAEYKRDYPHEVVKQWSKIADAADGFVFIVPEYNYGYSAVLKNALDWLWPEFNYKAAGFVGVSSGVVGGARAIAQLRGVMGAFKMYDIRETVMFGPVKNAFNDEGRLTDESYGKRIDGLVQSIIFASEKMKAFRN